MTDEEFLLAAPHAAEQSDEEFLLSKPEAGPSDDERFLEGGGFTISGADVQASALDMSPAATSARRAVEMTQWPSYTPPPRSQGLTEPFAAIPRVTATDLDPNGGKIAQVAAGVNRAAASFLEFFESPMGLMGMGAGAVLPRVVAGLFAADMVKNQPAAARAFGEATAAGNLEQQVETGLGLAANTAFATMAGKHAWGKRGPATIEQKIAKETKGETDAAVSPELERALDEAFLEEGKDTFAAIESAKPQSDAAFLEQPAEVPTSGVRAETEAMADAPSGAQVRGAAASFERPADVLDWMEGQGVKLRKLAREEGSDLTEPWLWAQKATPEAFDLKGRNPDEVADAYRRATGKEISAEDFLAEVAGVKVGRAEALEAHKAAWGRASQDAAFQERAVEGKRAKAKGPVEAIEAQELAEGDRFQIDGETVVVERVKVRADDETMVERVTVKDGPKFGTQVLPADQAVKIDAGSLTRAEAAPKGVEAWADAVIAEARGTAFSGLDPKLMTAYAVKGAATIVRLGRDFGVWAAEMVKAYGESIREHLPAIRKQAEEMVDSGWQGADLPAALRPGQGERQFPKQVDASSDVSNDVRLQQGPRLYDRRSNVDDAAAAAEIIDGHGLEQAGRVFRDEQAGLPEAVRTALGLALVKRWGQREQVAALSKDAAGEKAAIDAQLELLDAVTRRSTEMAQGLQAMAMWQRLTPAGYLEASRRVIEGARAQRMGGMGPGLENIRRVIEEVNDRTSGEALSDPAVAPRVAAVIEESLPNQANAKLLLTRTIVGLWDSLWTESRVWQEMVREQGAAVQEIARRHFAGEEPGKTLATKLYEALKIDQDTAWKLAAKMNKEFARQVAAEAKAAAKRAAEAAKREEARRRKISTEKSVWAREKAAAAEQLVQAARGALSAVKARGPMEAFAARLTAQLRRELQRRLPERAAAVEKLPAEAVLREAANHAERYNEVWGQAQMEIRKAFAGQPEALAALDKVLGAVAPDLFSTPAIDVLLREAMAARKLEFGKLVKEHFTVADSTGKALAEKIAERMGIEPERARWVSEAIEKRFREMAGERKRAALSALSLPARVGSTLAKGLHEKLIELSNLGALEDAAFDRVVAERLKLPQWTRELALDVKKRAEEIQKTPEGFQRERKAIDLLDALERAKGMSWQELPMAFLYANWLSGPTTQALNLLSTGINTAGNIGLQIGLSGGRGFSGIMEAAGRGLIKGAREGRQVLAGGKVTGTRLLKVEASRPLELTQFKGVLGFLNAWKYVMRGLSAGDLVFFKSAEEVRSYVTARAIAKREGVSGAELEKRVREAMGWTAERKAAAAAQADLEGTPAKDRARRVEEILEQQRPADMRENAKEYALRVTFNQRPWGLLGKMANGINQAASAYPIVRLVAPFTNIVANVVNEALNWGPAGLGRAAWGSWRGELEGKPITDPAILKEQWAKALAGTAALTALGVLAARELDSDDPKFMVTGGGPRTAGQKKQLMETGWIPYSIKMGDRYYAYGWSPAAIGLSVLGNYLDGVRYKNLDDTDLLNRTAYAVGLAGQVIVEQSFLSGIADLITTLERDSSSKSGQTATRWATRTASSFAVPNLLRQIDRIFDPTIYDAKTVEANLVASVPFARRLNRPAINVLGEPVKNYVSSRFVSEARGDAVWEMLAAKQAWVSVPDRETLLRGRPMSEDEYYRFVQMSGQAIRQRIVRDMGRIQSARPEMARELVAKIVEEERTKAKGRL